jgi:hypothetical protein
MQDKQKMTDFKTILLGHPRCGSRSLAAALSNYGLICGHERLERDGMVSWWHTGHYLGGSDFNNGKKTPSKFSVSLVGHYIRNPIDAVPSILIENEQSGRENNSFKFRDMLLRRWYGVDISAMPPLAAAATSYALWNDKAAKFSDLNDAIKVENPDIRELIDKLSDDCEGGETLRVISVPRLNTTDVKFGINKERYSRLEILQSVDGDIRRSLQRYFDLYSEKHNA